MNKYYIGLDIGTDSIGWAVTNKNYEIQKLKGNSAWGIRLIEGGKTAEERRNFRSSRRRTKRNKFRQQCLQMLFNEEISKKDIAFFQRLKESNLYLEDKTSNCKYSLFNDKNYTDKNLHQDFPTLYHLRKELIENPEPHDVRLVYLALSHIIKHRGHFLFDSDFENSKNQLNFKAIWGIFCTYCKDNYNFDLFYDDTEEIFKILKDSKTTKTKKKQLLSELLSISKKNNPAEFAVITLITGGTTLASQLFSDDSYKECECKNICISNGFDDNSSSYQNIFGEKFELLEEIKAVYDWATLSNILNNNKYISYAKVETFEKHKKDLILLKSYIKNYCPEKYNLVFNQDKKEIYNYLSYSKHVKKDSPEQTNCTQENFCEFLKKQLPKDCGDQKYLSMYEEIASGTFMPKVVSKDNSVIPMQIHKAELLKILQNAEQYLPFLNKKDKSEKTVSQKIIDIFSFRIPYYVGPLNTHSNKHWLSRTNEKIYPWNFENVVDINQSAENFIENLTSKCTYLPKEDVIPKCSLLYSSFMVLNELNNIKINDEYLSVPLKQKIYNELFLKHNKITQKLLINFLKIQGYTEISISGIDGDFKSNLKPYRDLMKFSLKNSEKEEIIKAITIFGDDKKLLKNRIKNKFNFLSTDEITAICRLKYSGWSRLSKKFLMKLEGVIGETGELLTIIRALWETQNNLMQLLSSKNTFIENIEKENENIGFKSLHEEVESLYISPKIKRPIYQTMQIIEELVKIQGQAPEKIFIEVARGPEEKVPTVSRKKKLEELYKNAKKQEPELYSLLQKYDENDLRRDALYLYFTQKGRCMYTGEPIEIEDLYNKNIYDIDHIFPQSKIKDDSLNNRVLVLKTINEEKGNIYPIKSEIRQKMQEFWKTLADNKFIEKSKYQRLIRSTSLTDDELTAFINRQLVETRQSTKAIANLLRRKYENSEVVYVKAGLVSDFRHKYNLIKCREINDFHHAKDAYLNIVVGNVYNTQFNHNKYVYINGLQSGKYSIKKMFEYSVKDAWETQNNISISTVKKVMSKNDILFTRYAYCQKGGLFDQNIVKKGNGQVSIKQNSPRSNVTKYGGYNRATSTYFALASYIDKKGETIKIIIPIDLYREKEYMENPKNYISSYIKTVIFKELDVKTVKIIIPRLKYNVLISVNGFRMHISSKSSGGTAYVCKPAIQLILPYNQEKYIKSIGSYLQKCAEKRREPTLTILDPFSKEKNIELYKLLENKVANTIFNVKFKRLSNILKNREELFASLSIYEQCFVLMQIINILHTDVRTGDLTLIKEAKKSGVTSIGNKITNSNEITSFKIVHQSITGLFETEIELLDK